jgi:hypothetical protein
MNHRRRGGRPSIYPGDTPARVHVTVSSGDYDKAYRIAQREGVSVAEVLRRGISRAVSDESDQRRDE